MTIAATITELPFLEHGVLASVPIDRERDAADEHTAVDLHGDEQRLAESMPPLRRAAFVAGRRALRAAIQRVSPNDAQAPLLHTRRGAPQLPTGMTGSISHKRTRAIAIAATSSGEKLGLDLEHRPTSRDLARPSLARRILTEHERTKIASAEPLAHREATLLHFALKEAVYKSIDPYVERYVRFTEVELDIHDDGTASVRLFLPELSDNSVNVSAAWRLDDEWIVAMARSRRR